MYLCCTNVVMIAIDDDIADGSVGDVTDGDLVGEQEVA